MSQQKKQNKQDLEKDGDPQVNIKKVRRDGDLPPRQISQLKGGNKKIQKHTVGKSLINTRSKTGSKSTSDQ